MGLFDWLIGERDANRREILIREDREKEQAQSQPNYRDDPNIRNLEAEIDRRNGEWSNGS